MPPRVVGIAKHFERLWDRGSIAASVPPLLHGWWRRNPLPSRPLIVVAAALAIGTAIALAWPLPAPWCWSGAVVSFLAWWALARRGHAASGPVLLMAVAFSGAAWATACWRLFPADELAWALDERPRPLVVEGRLLEAPRRRSRPSDPLRGGSLPETSESLLEVQGVRDGETWRPASGRAKLIIDGPPPSVSAGSDVRVWGRGLRPPRPGNPGEFDQRARARQERTLAVVRVAGAEGLECLRTPTWPSIADCLDQLRSRGEATLAAHVSAARAPLAAALLLGTRDGLAADATEPFMLTGTVHILSISGLHIALLAGGLFVVARLARVPRGPALVAVAVAIGLYMVLVGAQTPVLRATLLVWLTCLGGAFGRRSSGLNALAAAAIIVLACHPPDLLRIGSQLSFLSTAVLVGAASARAAVRRVDDPIARLIDRARSPAMRWIRHRGADLADIMLVGAAVWLATAPIVAAMFHVVSPVGLLLNPLIAPFVALAMVGGFACLLAAPVSGMLAAVGGGLCDGALLCVDVIVAHAARFPGAYAWVAGPPAWWTFGWYAGFVAILLVTAPPRLVRPFTWGVAAVAWAAVGLIAMAGPRLAAAPVEAVVAAMGHGCGIVVRGPEGRCLVYDAGRLGAGIAAGRGISAVLWSMGVSRIDTLVISHADTDHFNGVPDLLERFAIGRVVVPEAFLGSSAPAVVEILGRIGAAGIPLTTAAAGDEIPFERSCRVCVLHPAPGGEPQDGVSRSRAGGTVGPSDNETSLVVAVESAGRRILLTGDLEGAALDRFVAAGPADCDVLVAPHHGSPASLPPTLATATTPEYVIVSGFDGPRWDEVRRAYEVASGPQRPALVLRTSGAVRLRLTAGSAEASQFQDGRWRRVCPMPRAAPGVPAESGGNGIKASSGDCRGSSSLRPALGG